MRKTVRTVRLLFYLICYDLCCSLCTLNSRQAHQGTDSLLVCVQTDKDTWREREQRKQQWQYLLSFPPSHSEMFLSLPWEQECQTSALVTNKHLEAAGERIEREKKMNKSSVSSEYCQVGC